MDMKLTERLAKETARDYAARMIRDNIISLVLEPGSFVSEKELSITMGLSRTPVREALIELSKGGIVEIFPQHGSMVSKIDYERIEEAVFLRETIEVAVVSLACDKASVEDVNYLGDNIMLQDACLARDDGPGLLQLDNDFHSRLFSAAKKEFCYSLMKSMAAHFDRVRQMSLVAMKNTKIVDDHKAIFKAIVARDAERAKETMHQHLKRYQIDKGALHKKYNPKFFKDSSI